MTTIACVYGSQTSPVIFCMQNSVPSIRITSLYGSSPHLWFSHPKQRLLDLNSKSLSVPDIICRFVPAMQRDSHQNYLSLWVPAHICNFCMQNSDFCTRITTLYGSQTSPVLLCIQNSMICTRISSLYGIQPSSVVLCLKNSAFRTRLTSLYGSQTSTVVLSTHNSLFSTIISTLYWFQLSPVVLCMQNSDFRTRITRHCAS